MRLVPVTILVIFSLMPAVARTFELLLGTAGLLGVSLMLFWVLYFCLLCLVGFCCVIGSNLLYFELLYLYFTLLYFVFHSLAHYLLLTRTEK